MQWVSHNHPSPEVLNKPDSKLIYRSYNTRTIIKTHTADSFIPQIGRLPPSYFTVGVFFTNQTVSVMETDNWLVCEFRIIIINSVQPKYVFSCNSRFSHEMRIPACPCIHKLHFWKLFFPAENPSRLNYHLSSHGGPRLKRPAVRQSSRCDRSASSPTFFKDWFHQTE